MKIMKKAAAVLLAGVLVLGTAVTAFASSPETSSTKTANITATAEAAGITGTAKSASTGKTLNIIISNEYSTDEHREAAEKIAADPMSVLEQLGLSTTGMVFKAVYNVEVEGAESGETVSVTFSVPNVTTGSTVYVLRYVDGAWVQVTGVVLADGTVTIEYPYAEGPFTIYVDEDTAKAGTTSGDSSTGTTSPKTGEVPVMPVALLVIALAAAGMVISSRKKTA
ncbi:MAG: hypothetical protein LIO96_11475 [Lachnospiraceae bacterium]|nr:hypothetical protein [Lachnospiraceae bacterium]